MINSFEVHALHYTVVSVLQSLQNLLTEAGHIGNDKIKSFDSFAAKVGNQKTISSIILDIILVINPAGWPKDCQISLRLQNFGPSWNAIESNIYYPKHTKRFINFKYDGKKGVIPAYGDDSKFFKPKK